MCGIIGVMSRAPVNQLLYDGLLILQHRGQDAAGIVTREGKTFHMHKGGGLVRDVFRTRNMRSLLGNMGIGHVRYPTAGSADSAAEAQPFYVNSPFGLCLAHNGNLTNSDMLVREMFETDRRHVNTQSDSEVLLNVFAHELQQATRMRDVSPDAIFDAVTGVHRRCEGAYAVVALVTGGGLLAFRDPWGIRPLVIGIQETEFGTEYVFASESVALDALGFRILRDVLPGEAVLVDDLGRLHARQCASAPKYTPCIFEYVYFARPDSVMDGVSIYEARLNMGIFLAEKIKTVLGEQPDIDVVIPIPDTSRPSALQLANHLNIPYREGFIKNRYIGRTFIMPGQSVRKKSVRQKLNAIGIEFKGKSVLLVDDSIVRGTTSKEIVQMARDSGARRVIFASAAPPVRFPNVYGIDMPTRAELLATGRTDEQIAEEIGADAVIYQDLDKLRESVERINGGLDGFETSCFDGCYITGDVTDEYLSSIEQARSDSYKVSKEGQESRQLDLNLSTGATALGG